MTTDRAELYPKTRKVIFSCNSMARTFVLTPGPPPVMAYGNGKWRKENMVWISRTTKTCYLMRGSVIRVKRVRNPAPSISADS